MTDDLQTETAPVDAKTAEPVPTREERAAALVAEMAHAMKHNAPVTGEMMAEMRDLLGVLAE